MKENINNIVSFENAFKNCTLLSNINFNFNNNIVSFENIFNECTSLLSEEKMKILNRKKLIKNRKNKLNTIYGKNN